LKPADVLRSIEREARRKGLPIIGPARGAFLDEAVIAHHPDRVLEVGTCVGYSAIRMARLLGDGGLVTCVEIDPGYARVAASNVAMAGLSDKVEILIGDAKKLLPELVGSFDMVFLDADKREYLGYLKACERLLHRGSVVAADNVKSHPKEVANYLDYVRNSGRFKSGWKEPSSDYRFGARSREADAVEISVVL